METERHGEGQIAGRRSETLHLRLYLIMSEICNTFFATLLLDIIPVDNDKMSLTKVISEI